MKIEKLNTNKITSKGVLIGFIVCLIFVIIVSLFTSKAKYQNTQSIKIVEGKVNYILPDLNVVAAYQKDDQGTYQKVENIPKSGYALNKSDSYCTMPDNDDNKIYTMLEYNNGKLTVDITKKGTKCYLYFEKQKTPSEQTLAKLEIKSTTPLDANNLSGTSCNNGCKMQQNGVFEVEDQDGNPSYVYRGTVDNNWVKFGGFWWRIIRVNGNGSLRVIYAGSESDGPQNTGPTTQIGTSKYNEKYDNNMYIGFKYTDGQRQGNGTSSTVLGDDTNPASGTLNKWYNDNIKLKGLEQYIEKDEIFCNDRRSSTNSSTPWGLPWSSNTGGTGTDTTYYGARLRTGSWKATQQATLSCDKEDQFSSSSTIGNGKLVNPIGLITMDEVLLAGGFGGQNNNSYWLYTSSAYWTMSPCYYSSGFALVFYVDNKGDLNNGNVFWTVPGGVRPVINLKADNVQIGSGSGNPGTTTKPFVVS